MLLAYDQSAAENILTTDGTATGGTELCRLPASAAAGADGAPVNVTIPLRDLSASVYTALNIRASAAATRFRVEWTLGFPEYNIGDLAFTVRQSVGAGVSRKRDARFNPIGNIANLASTSTTMDGGTAVADNRVYLTDQTTGAENGLYRVASVTGGNCRLVRAQDMDESTEVEPGTSIIVSEGTVRANTLLTITNSATITIGTTALTHTRESLANADILQCVASGTLNSGDAVYINGWDVTNNLPTVTFADADSATAGARRPSHVMRGTVVNAAVGQAYKTHTLTVVAGGALNAPVYLATAGVTGATLTLTDPSLASDVADAVIVGRVSNAATTRWDLDLRAAALEAVGERSISATITQTWTGLHTFNAGATLGSGFATTLNARLVARMNSQADGTYVLDTGVDDIAFVMPPTQARAITLPAAVAGRMVIIKCASASGATPVQGSLTITRAGADTIDTGASTAQTAMVLPAGASAIFIGVAGGWHAICSSYCTPVAAAADAAFDLRATANAAVRFVTGTPSVARIFNLPSAAGTGRSVTIKNLIGSAGSIAVTPEAGDQIDAGGAGIANALAAGQSATYTDAAANVWIVT